MSRIDEWKAEIEQLTDKEICLWLRSKEGSFQEMVLYEAIARILSKKLLNLK